jgi:D-beta-D-heptose 7-phosphate kinase/D-beta-D-heptose 1-phosphate adenosyltransferase
MSPRLRLPADVKARLLKAIADFPGYRILVVGDLILDVFIWGKVNRVSPEAPVPVVDVTTETPLLGGAANVVHNLAALGAQVNVAGLIGHDPAGELLTELLQRLSIPTHGVIVENGRPTTVKTRIIAHSQQVVRFDREWRKAPDSDSQARLQSYLQAVVPNLDAVVVSDYGKGVVTAELMAALRSLAAGGSIPILVDPKIHHLELYRQVTMITPNHYEASAMSGIDIQDEASLQAAGRKLLEHLQCRMVLITRGEAGMTLFQQRSEPLHIPTVARRVFDVTGAGDTVISTLALAMVAGLEPPEAAVLANLAAGLVVGEIGTATVSAERLQETIVNGA